MEPEPVIQEIAEAFLRFVDANPDMAITLHVRVGSTSVDLAYRARELAHQGALAFGIREPSLPKPSAARTAVAAERR